MSRSEAGSARRGGRRKDGLELTIVLLIQVKNQLRVSCKLKKMDDWDGVGLLREDRSDGVSGRRKRRRRRRRERSAPEVEPHGLPPSFLNVALEPASEPDEIPSQSVRSVRSRSRIMVKKEGREEGSDSLGIPIHALHLSSNLPSSPGLVDLLDLSDSFDRRPGT